jgi:hypothetical protein
MPESWFLHDAAGNRIQSAANPASELMNPRSTAAFRPGSVTYHGWADYVTRECLRDQTRLTSGCFLDTIGPDPLRRGTNLHGRVPVDPGTGAPFTYRSYMMMQAHYVAHVQARTRHAVVANAFSSGNAYFTRSTYLIDRVGNVAGEAEVWMAAGTWKQNVQMLINNARFGSGCLVNFDASPKSLERQREYITASFLIGRGRHQFLQFSDTRASSSSHASTGCQSEPRCFSVIGCPGTSTTGSTDADSGTASRLRIPARIRSGSGSAPGTGTCTAIS